MGLTCLDENQTIYKLLIRKFVSIKVLYTFIEKQKKKLIFMHKYIGIKGTTILTFYLNQKRRFMNSKNKKEKKT